MRPASRRCIRRRDPDARGRVRMKRAAPASIAGSAGTLIGHLTVAGACVALLAACSASGGTRNTAATVPSTVPTSATAKATTTTTTPHNIYRVKRGDTLSKIANQFRISISAIVARNHIANPDHLRDGQTLVIPPTPPRKLIVSPHTGHPGQAFQLALTGAVPSETIKFQVASPKSKYTGGPHAASADGAVIAMYQTALSDPTGVYTVTATGNRGTTVRATFVVVATATNTT
jgi:LysM repeat protein